ncbi:tryptophan synthase subunit alpha [Anaerolineales bacterium]
MSTDVQNQGLQALKMMFEKAEKEQRAAFLPYYPIGFPDFEASIASIKAMSEVGVDGFEIGVPFSDPVADGPTVQAATQIALNNGITVRKCLEAVRRLRADGVKQPMLAMSYANPLIAYGTDRFIKDAAEAGVDGLIIPDLPPEEAYRFSDACTAAGLALVFFLAPTSNEERIKLVAETATGFIYVVSLTGITGTRAELPTYLKEFIANLRRYTDTKLVMGFGISTAEHALVMNGLLDGFIVGSALVKAGENGPEAVKNLAKTLREALN